MFDHFVYALLSFCARKFPAKYETREHTEITVECILYDCAEGAVIVMNFY